MSKGSGNTRSGSSSNPRGLARTSFGDFVTNYDRNYLFNNPTLRGEIETAYPGVSFGSSGNFLTVNQRGINEDVANEVVIFMSNIKKIEPQVKVEDTTWIGGAKAIKATYKNMQVTATRNPDGNTYLVEETYSDEGKWQEAPNRSFTRNEVKNYASSIFARWEAEDEVARRKR